ncbi:MAG TPA: amidohydrolase family protein [Stellaceae bacterium]|nr:amidohydrolase family protein [Stellaceae bacterium]
MAESKEQRKPRFVLPTNATDCHFHVYEKGARFPDHEMDRALALHRRLGIGRGILVQPDVQSRAITLKGLALAGPNYRGVTPIAELPSEKGIEALHAAGMRGARFIFLARHGIRPDIATMRQTVERIAPFGWHVVFLMDPQDMLDVFDFLRGLTVPFVLDHIGRVDVGGGLEHPAFRALLELVRRDNGWVKLSGSDRVSKAGPPFHEAIPYAQALIAAAPDRVIWGSDWPHPANLYDPEDADLVDLIPLMAPDAAQQRKMLVDNPARLVGF